MWGMSARALAGEDLDAQEAADHQPDIHARSHTCEVVAALLVEFGTATLSRRENHTLGIIGAQLVLLDTTSENQLLSTLRDQLICIARARCRGRRHLGVIIAVAVVDFELLLRDHLAMRQVFAVRRLQQQLQGVAPAAEVRSIYARV